MSELTYLIYLAQRAAVEAAAKDSFCKFFRLSSGELAAYNNSKINEINVMLETVATRSELHDVAQTIIGQHQSDIKGALRVALYNDN